MTYTAEEVADAIRIVTHFDHDALEDLTDALGVLEDAIDNGTLPEHHELDVAGDLQFSLRSTADRLDGIRDTLTTDDDEDDEDDEDDQ
jgi:hypothetical protein